MNELIPADDLGPYATEGNPNSRVEDFTYDPFETIHEIALVRFQIQRAINEGAPPTVIAQLSSVAGKLSREWLIQAVRSNRMIHVNEANRYASDLASAMALAFSDVPGYEARIDAVLAGMRMQNSKSQEIELLGRIK